jgi:hypothetical protein
MYSSKPSVVYGFHGTDQRVATEIINQRASFSASTNTYDWLGHGIYFWENNLERASQYAVEDSQRSNSKIKHPCVIGTVIDLGNCLDLLDQKNIDALKSAYKSFIAIMKEFDRPIPQNTSFGTKDFDFKKRELDCAVIRFYCEFAKSEGRPFDSVRAAFIEGEPIYPNAKFYTQNHIQLAIVNPDCIKGIFFPRIASI